ncbi:glycosyltransferase, family 1 (GT1) [Lactiplantibacillus pentosus KCA1]|nr:glycosyltransferase family 4 protein [Lactiplantibacillus pentosus]EIW13625.1 glycosyltransferase, family 1 (GT1) [Lactiplantibacillus pentosus KCA1]
MKIVYVITQATWGGAQAHLYSLIQQQVRLGNQVTLVCGKTGWLSTRVGAEFPTVAVVPISSLVRQIAPISDLSAIRTLRTLLRNRRPDIVHLHSSKAGMIGRLAAAGLHLNVVFTVHGWGFTPGVGKKRQLLMKSIEKSLRHLTTYYICVSQFDYALGVKNGVITKRRPGRVIHNGVTALNTSRHSKCQDTFVLSMAARFDAPKRQDLLIRALSYLPEEIPVACNMLGDGPLLQECRNLADRLNVSSRVQFRGVVDNVQHYYQQSDVAVLISDYEALPISLVEALAQGLPIIASRVGGIDELIHENGYLVENDAKQIAEKIILLYQSNQMAQLKRNSYQIYEHQYTEQAMLAQTQACYLQCLT